MALMFDPAIFDPHVFSIISVDTISSPSYDFVPATPQDNDLIDYYTNLLIIQYHDKPKARATISAYIAILMIYDVAIKARDAFNLDTAEGNQLDTIGKYVGADRIVYGTSFTRAYFGFAEYGDSGPFTYNPFMKYRATVPDEKWYSYRETGRSLFALTDSELLTIIKLKIIQNNAAPSTQLIDELNSILFVDPMIFTDRQNMSVGYIFPERMRTLMTIAQSEGLLPKPSGVSLTISFTGDTTAVFSYSSYGGDMPDFAIGFAAYGDSIPRGGWAYYG